MTKKEIRDEMKRRRARMSEKERSRQNLAIYHAILAEDIWQDLSCFFPFVSVGTEVDTIALIQRVLTMQEEGASIRVAVPRVEGREMDFYEIHSLQDLEEGSYGIREPRGYCRKILADQGLMLLPGLAFDRNGGRVGYGGGFYDRYLSRHGSSHLMTWAPAYDFQLVDRLAVESHDIAPQKIITPDEVIRTMP